MSMNIFQIMTGVTKGYKPTPDELKEIPPFIWCRFLSGNPNLLAYANLFNNDKIPMELQYQIISNVCKEKKIKYIPYPKNTSVKPDEDLEILARHFKINLDKAREYLELIDKSELEGILKMYKETGGLKRC